MDVVGEDGLEEDGLGDDGFGVYTVILNGVVVTKLAEPGDADVRMGYNKLESLQF